MSVSSPTEPPETCPALRRSYYRNSFTRNWTRKSRTMAEYHLVDPTTAEVNAAHAIANGQCPVCRVFWSERPDKTCDCFFLGSHTDGNGNRERWRPVWEVIQALRT